MNRIAVLLSSFLVAVAAHAQPAPPQQPPSIEFLQGVITALEAQRNATQSMHLGAVAQNSELNVMIGRLQARVGELTKQLAEAKAVPKDEAK